jgi:hypothetical protein
MERAILASRGTRFQLRSASAGMVYSGVYVRGELALRVSVARQLGGVSLKRREEKQRDVAG